MAAQKPGSTVLMPGAYILLGLEGERVVCHAALAQAQGTLGGEAVAFAGLCEVTVARGARGHGAARALATRARQEMSLLGEAAVFTCAPGLPALYQAAGFSYRPHLVLVGGTKEKPLRSETLGLCVMAEALSPAARRLDLTQGEILLPLGEGKLW